MNLNKKLAAQLSPGELQDFIRALAVDNVIIPAIIKILEYRAEQTKPTFKMMDEPNYSYRRTFLDGRMYELEWLVRLISTKEMSDNGRDGDRDDNLG